MVCDSVNDSIIHEVQFNVNCQIISLEDCLINYLEFSEV